MSSFKTTNYRWVVLLVFMINTIVTQLDWLTFAPIMNDVAKDYNVTIDAITLLTASYMIFYIIMNFPATWALDRFGLKWGSGIGVILTGVFGFVRVFAGDNFAILAFAQIMTALGQPFLLNSFTKLAINWFSESEKATSTGLGTISILIGDILGMVLTPIIYEAHGISYLLWVYGIIGIVAMVIYFIFALDIPEIPPNAQFGSKVYDFQGVKGLFKNKNFNILFFIVLVGLGAFNAISTEIDIIFDRFQDPSAPGLIGGIMIFGGIIGAGILSTLSDYLHKRKIFLQLAVLVATPLLPLFVVINNFTIMAIIAFVFGFFLVSALPVALIYAAEVTYPVSEEASNGILMTIGQISGIILLISFSMYTITFLFAVAAILSFLLRDVDANNNS